MKPGEKLGIHLNQQRIDQYNRLRDLYPGLPENINLSAFDTIITLLIDANHKPI